MEHIDSVERYLEQARKAIQAGDRRTAAILINQVLKTDFTNSTAWNLLHALSGPGESLEVFQAKFAQKYYPDQAHLLKIVPNWFEEMSGTASTKPVTPQVNRSARATTQVIPKPIPQVKGHIHNRPDASRAASPRARKILIAVGVLGGLVLMVVLAGVLALRFLPGLLSPHRSTPFEGVWLSPGGSMLEMQDGGILVMHEGDHTVTYQYTIVDDSMVEMTNLETNEVFHSTYQYDGDTLTILDTVFLPISSVSEGELPTELAPIETAAPPKVTEPLPIHTVGPTAEDMATWLAPGQEGFYVVDRGLALKLERIGVAKYSRKGINTTEGLPVTTSKVPVILVRSSKFDLTGILALNRLIGGIGATLKEQNGQVLIGEVKVFDIGAGAAGLWRDDAILSVNGVAINGDKALALSLMRGELGAWLKLVIASGTEKREVSVQRNVWVDSDKYAFTIDYGSNGEDFARVIPNKPLPDGHYCMILDRNDNFGDEVTQLACFIVDAE